MFNEARPTMDQDAEIAEYRAICPSTVIAVIFGLLSPFAVLHYSLWFIPVLGIVFAIRALWRIAQHSSQLMGRKGAVFALFLCVLTLAMGITDWYAHRWMYCREASSFNREWIEFLLNDQPEKAFQLTIHPRYRQKLDSPIWGFYRKGPKWQRQLEDYVKEPIVHTLLALGPKTEVRRFDTLGPIMPSKNLQVQDIYAITYNDAENERTTFFIAVTVDRLSLTDGTANWQIQRVVAIPNPFVQRSEPAK